MNAYLLERLPPTACGGFSPICFPRTPAQYYKSHLFRCSQKQDSFSPGLVYRCCGLIWTTGNYAISRLIDGCAVHPSYPERHHFSGWAPLLVLSTLAHASDILQGRASSKTASRESAPFLPSCVNTNGQSDYNPSLEQCQRFTNT